MALLDVFLAGENPQANAGGNYECVQVQSGTQWERETSILTGSWSEQSYKVTLDAGGESAALRPITAAGSVPTTTRAKLVTIFAHRTTDTTPADYVAWANLVPVSVSGTYVSQIIHNTDGDLELWDSAGSVLATATTPITVDTWHYWRIMTEYDSGADSLRWRLWRWGSSDPADGSGWGSALIDYTETTSGVTTGLLYLQLTAQGNPKGVAPNVTYYWDDIYQGVPDADSDMPEEPVKVYCLRPSGTGSNSNFTGGTGTNPDAADVDDDAGADDDTTTDASVTPAATQTQTYALDDFAGTLTASDRAIVGVVARWKNTGGSAIQQRVAWVENGTTNNSGINGQSASSYDNSLHILSTPPSSGGVWDTTKINAFEAGCRKGALAGSGTMTVTQAYALVGVFEVPAATQQGQPVSFAAGGVAIA